MTNRLESLNDPVNSKNGALSESGVSGENVARILDVKPVMFEVVSQDVETSLETSDRAAILEGLCRSLLVTIGEDPTREGLLKTPARFASSMLELCSGYNGNLDELVNGAVFSESGSNIVAVTDMPFFSLCEHHILPFFGTFSVAYRPAGRIIGLSKIPRLVDMFSRRLQVQERLTREVAIALDSILSPESIVCRSQASHLCSAMRGVRAGQSKMTVFAFQGKAESNLHERQELVACF